DLVFAALCPVRITTRCHFHSVWLFVLLWRPPTSTLFPYTTLFRSLTDAHVMRAGADKTVQFFAEGHFAHQVQRGAFQAGFAGKGDRKSTRLNSSHVKISYAVFCLKKKTRCVPQRRPAPRERGNVDEVHRRGPG